MIKKRMQLKLTHKLFFSLIEIMLGLAIIAICSSLVGIKLSKSISKYNFDRNSRQIVEKLKFANSLARTNQCDVELILNQKSNKIICEVDFRGIKDSKEKNKMIFSNIYFTFKPYKNKKVKKYLKIEFSSTGYFAPNGILYLKKDKKQKPKEIDLKELFLKENFLSKITLLI